jgi:hypothetical protein
MPLYVVIFGVLIFLEMRRGLKFPQIGRLGWRPPSFQSQHFETATARHAIEAAHKGSATLAHSKWAERPRRAGPHRSHRILGPNEGTNR